MSRSFHPLFAHISLLIATLAWQSLSVAPGAEFRNLGFEEADFTEAPFFGDPWPTTSADQGDVSQLLPGWKLFLGTNVWSTINYNTPGFPVVLERGFPTADPEWEGLFCLALTRLDTSGPAFRLEQTGTVPADTRFLSYACAVSNGDLEVWMNNEMIPTVGDVPVGTAVTNLIFDVTRFAGKEVTLALVGPVTPKFPAWPPSNAAWTWIDNIRFVSAPPQVTVRQAGDHLMLSWPASTKGMILQSTDSLSVTSRWTTVPIDPVVVGNQVTAKVPKEGKSTYYRLGIE